MAKSKQPKDRFHFEHRPGLVAYVTCGDPDLKTTKDIVLAAIGAGADVIELGVPFSDPVADGPVIQRASERALKHGTSLEDVLRLAREVRRESDAGLVVFSYLNPVLRFGLQRFCSEAVAAGVDGALITDLTVEEAGDYCRAMAAHRLDTIFLAAPTSPDRRLKRIAQACGGFVYAVSRTGVTGTQKQLATDAHDLVGRIRKFTRLPVVVGFGVCRCRGGRQRHRAGCGAEPGTRGPGCGGVGAVVEDGGCSAVGGLSAPEKHRQKCRCQTIVARLGRPPLP